MHINTLLFISFLLLILLSIGCKNEAYDSTSAYEIPSADHDLSFTPFDVNLDDPNYLVCDSTDIRSGKNGLQYIGGKQKYKKDFSSNFSTRKEYESFTGYVVVRFIVNCQGKSGRYRAQALNLDFSPQDAPHELLQHSIALVKKLDNWTKTPYIDPQTEYSKYINLKLSNGEIQHVLF